MCENAPSPRSSCNRHDKEPHLGCIPAPWLGIPRQMSPWGSWVLGLCCLPTLSFRLCAYAFSSAQQATPGSWREMNSSRGTLISQPCTGSAEEQKPKRRLPFCNKAAHDTSKEKSCFPQCLFKRMGPSCSSHSTEKGTDLPALRSWELGANSALCRQISTAASIFCLLTLVENWNLKKQVTRQNKTKQTAAMFHLWYTVHVCLPTLSSKKPLWIKSTNKTSYTIISLNRVVPGTVQRATLTVLNRMRDVEWDFFLRCLMFTILT